jgi:hypothetical protein
VRRRIASGVEAATSSGAELIGEEKRAEAATSSRVEAHEQWSGASDVEHGLQRGQNSGRRRGGSPGKRRSRAALVEAKESSHLIRVAIAWLLEASSPHRVWPTRVLSHYADSRMRAAQGSLKRSQSGSSSPASLGLGVEEGEKGEA